MGFLGAIWSTLFFIGIAVFSSTNLVFLPESLPTFILRAVFEIILLFVVLHAIKDADRSTLSSLRVLTIPLLLLVDITLGYAMSAMQMAGVLLLMASAAIILFKVPSLASKGKIMALTSAVLAVITISLYKYDITNFNSVEAEQGLMYFILLIALLIGSIVQGHENVFRYLLRPVCLFQSITAAAAAVFHSFAYVFMPASVILALSRSSEVFLSMISGRLYFHEAGLLSRAVAFLLIIAGITLCVL
ncbi:hypothetical protein KJ819_03760 [Patescibacteria group bacterium]|nr:hypothetical protein [Patescibacteria group bacterium]MBU1500477.1 hypothetical protein [Patescibacteria group bacterium]MBU2080725.1 hypothetical protein [Patescibacteria group bacterium]MBU2123830.1 hypothetical protein [Patescibacteria group bacterium]MBU2194879.1 hypothetical protein [Patescibacteria group bacterium]